MYTMHQQERTNLGTVIQCLLGAVNKLCLCLAIHTNGINNTTTYVNQITKVL